MSSIPGGFWFFPLAFASALLLSFGLTPLVRALALRGGIVAAPAADRWHGRTVPMLGGIAVMFATLIVVTAFGFSRQTAMVAVVSALMLGLGLLDDVRSLKPVSKLTVELVLACAVVALGHKLPWTGSPAIDALVTIVWIVGLTNAFNLLDNMDGLCAGISVIAALALCASTGALNRYAFVYTAALAGATLGFLRFNFQPASIFLGDCGSLFLGSSFALLTLSDAPDAQRGLISALVVPVFILLLPIFDTTFVTISRKLSGRAASQGGRDHTSHRLVALGFSERHATLFLYALAGVGGLAAAGLAQSNVESVGLGLLLLVGLALLAVQLAKVRVYTGNDFDRPAAGLVRFVLLRKLIVDTDHDEEFDGGTLLDESNDGGGLSLREALALAAADPLSHDTITFVEALDGGTADLTQGELVVEGNVTIDGNNDNDAAAITIDGGGASAVLHVYSGVVALNGLTITGGIC